MVNINVIKIITLARVGGGYSTLFVYVCVFVCVLPQNWCLHSIISISKQAAAPRPGNLRQTMVLYKTGRFFHASTAHIACKFENKKTNHTDITRKMFESS